MKKTTLTIIAIISVIFSSFAQNVNIPDENFKKYLLENSSINTNTDNNISVSEANAFNGNMYIPSLYIYSLVGIEYFVKLQYLYCMNNFIDSIDLSKNIALKTVVCDNCRCSTLKLNNNSNLSWLSCNKNYLTDLVLKGCTLLEYCDCSKNQLKTIDISKNDSLTDLNCLSNELLILNVSNNTKLEWLTCQDNPTLKIICVYPNQTTYKYRWRKDDFVNYSDNCITGIENNILTKNKTILATYNIQGQPVNNSYQGLVIIRYTDGTSEKVIQ